GVGRAPRPRRGPRACGPERAPLAARRTRALVRRARSQPRHREPGRARRRRRPPARRRSVVKGVNTMSDIETLVARARTAQRAIEDYDQRRTDELVTSVGWSVVKHKEELARAAVEEGGFGNSESKATKIRLRVTGVLRDMQGVKTVGVVEEIPARGLVKIAKPVGVVAALIPSTGPDATPPMKALAALKGRNAIIVAAHPKTQGSSALVVERMREGAKTVRPP